MKRLLLFCLLISAMFTSWAQCSVTSLVINTGYDPTTGAAVAPGSSSSPVTDPKWLVAGSNNVPGAASAGSPAYVIARVAAWAANPSTNPGNWISAIPSNTYTTDGAGTAYDMTLARPFRMCNDDSVTFTLYLANDNYISRVDVDGTTTLSFSQTAGASTTYYSTFTAFTQTIFLSAGTHTLNVVVNNYNLSYATSNPSGLDIYGRISSASGQPSLVYEGDTACNRYACTRPTCGSIGLADTVNACRDSSARLSATYTGSDSIISIDWSPASGLSSTTVLNPGLTATTPGTYILSVYSLTARDLIANGSFTFGNSAFTSEYRYVTASTTQGDYAIGNNPRTYNGAWTSMGDHTTGSGPMMIFDGATTGGLDLYCFTVRVTPGAYYNFPPG